MSSKISASFLVFVIIANLILDDLGVECRNKSYTPIVMYHGMGDTAYGSIDSIRKYLESKLRGVYVTSIQQGRNFEEDFLSSYFMNLNQQVSISYRQFLVRYRLTINEIVSLLVFVKRSRKLVRSYNPMRNSKMVTMR